MTNIDIKKNTLFQEGKNHTKKITKVQTFFKTFINKMLDLFGRRHIQGICCIWRTFDL